jgi:biotin synthase
MSEAAQMLGFMACANSIFTGDKLLIADNAGDDKDAAKLTKLGLVLTEAEEPLRSCKALEAAE